MEPPIRTGRAVTDPLHSRLVSLGAERLAEALLRLAERDDAAAQVVDRLLAPADEGVKRARRALAGLKRRRSFIPWNRSREMREKLLAVLAEIAESGADARTMLDLVARFFECDEAVVGNADDSSGIIGDVFTIDARMLWAEAAGRVEDQEWLVERTASLLENDEYGVRDSVLEDVGGWLDTKHLESLADLLWQRGLHEKFAAHAASQEQGRDQRPSFRRPRSMLLVKRVARALRDPELFERATREWCGGEVGGLDLDIAEQYVEAGRHEEALAWIHRRGRHEHHAYEYERRMLLQRIHAERGETEALVALIREDLEESPSVDTVERLVGLLGEEQREALVQEAIRIALASPFGVNSTSFLCDLGEFERAERFVVDHRDSIDGDHYYTLAPLRERFVDADRPLAATILGRALMESILGRASTRSYGHAARYWHDLAGHAKKIVRWQDVMPHGVYAEAMTEKHKRKTSFWARVEKEGAKRANRRPPR